MKEKIAKVRKGKTKNEGKVVYKTIKLYGFPLAIQSWLYDCIPMLSSFYGKKVNSTIPRMNNWKVVIENPSFDELAHIVFDSKVKYIILFIYFIHFIVSVFYFVIFNYKFYRQVTIFVTIYLTS